MPIWLRVLGVTVCFLPPIALVVALSAGSKSTKEVVGSILFLLVMYGLVFLLFLPAFLAPPLCWLLGVRPGALVGSAYLGLLGLAFSIGQTGSDRSLGLLLDLHFLLIGVLLWEWRQAARRRSRHLPAPSASPDAPDA